MGNNAKVDISNSRNNYCEESDDSDDSSWSNCSSEVQWTASEESSEEESSITVEGFLRSGELNSKTDEIKMYRCRDKKSSFTARKIYSSQSIMSSSSELHKRNFKSSPDAFNENNQLFTKQSELKRSLLKGQNRKLSRKKQISYISQHRCNQYPHFFSINNFLKAAIAIWILAQLRYFVFLRHLRNLDDDYYITNASHSKFQKYLKSKMPDLTEEEISEIMRRRQNAAMKALGSGTRPRIKRPSVETIPKDCVYSEWQTLSFPNCNLLHEYDLKVDLGMTKYGPKLPDLNAENHGFVNIPHNIGEYSHYVGSGLWRNVWKVKYQENDAKAVLKMMKMEHEVTPRNFDRHRRDAVVMERFTSHPNVVSMYGFCGNSVLTEFVGRGLDELIFQPTASDTEIYKRENNGVSSLFSRDNPKDRLILALEVLRGLEALHQIKSTETPIVHADIQAKQFLIDEIEGKVKINDFNRCRFLAHNITSKKSCPVKIPSAPGKQTFLIDSQNTAVRK